MSDPVLDIERQHAEEPVYAQGEFARDVESGKHALPGTVEKESGIGSGSGSGESVKSKRSAGAFYHKYKVFVHAFIFCLFTGYPPSLPPPHPLSPSVLTHPDGGLPPSSSTAATKTGSSPSSSGSASSSASSSSGSQSASSPSPSTHSGPPPPAASSH